jgi:cytidylate kinase
MLITISREFGSCGSLVAARVAKLLGWDLVDNQLVEEVARRAGMTEQEVKAKEERGPTFVERLARALAAATPELLTPKAVELPEAQEARLVKITEQVVADAIQDHAVLVGRAATAVVGRRENALHVRVVGPVDYRAQIIADRLGISFEEAGRRVRDVDAHRARYHQQYYHRDWADPAGYHLVVNTGWLGVDRAAAVIVAAVRKAQA